MSMRFLTPLNGFRGGVLTPLLSSTLIPLSSGIGISRSSARYLSSQESSRKKSTAIWSQCQLNNCRGHPLNSIFSSSFITQRFRAQLTKPNRRWLTNNSTWTPHTLPSATSSPLSTPLPTYNAKVPQKIAYIALGSNLGDKITWIQRACSLMSSHGIHVSRTSLLYETKPMYVFEQDPFVNGVCEVKTSLGPLALLDALQSIENELGRKKVIDKGPRNIDLDILLYEEETVDYPRLRIPHPGITEREFVLRPLADLIPGQSILKAKPWRVIADYLNALPEPDTAMGTVSPLKDGMDLRALDPRRKTNVMAILNMTPDSFSDGGVHDFTPTPKLVATVRHFVEKGATIIDIGGESTRPGATPVSPEEEISRVVPVIKMIKKEFGDVTISIDTYHATVALEAVGAGADIINDVSAGLLDPNMLPTVAQLGKPVVLMHMRGTPKTMNSLTSYPEGLIPTIAKELLERVAAAEAAGVRRWNIILDPGIGFAKTAEQNLEVLRRIDELREWPGLRGMPWLLGSSRKGFVREITGERLMGTAATVVAAVVGGADVVRVHDVGEMMAVAKMADAIWRV